MEQHDDLEILCKHLAEKLDVNIRFEDGAVPSASEKEIILPKDFNREIILELLAALLHESAHIRYTRNWRPDRYNYDEKFFPVLANHLEDIRVDTQMINKYPMIGELHFCMAQYALNKLIDKFKLETEPYQVLKHMNFRFYGQMVGKPDAFVYNPKALQVIEHLKLDEIVQQAKDARSSEEILTVIAPRLYKILMDYYKQDENRVKQTNITGKLAEQLQKAIEGYNKSKEQFMEARTEEQTTYDQTKNLRSTVRRNETIGRRAEYEKQSHQQALKSNQLTPEQIAERSAAVSEAEQKKVRAERRLVQHRQNMAQSNQKLGKATDKRHKLGEEMDKNRNQGDEASRVLKSLTDPNSVEYATGINECEVEMNGFGALQSNDLKPQTVDKSIKLQKSLDQRIREFFIKKKEYKQRAEEGRLDRNSLYKIYTDPENIYKDVRQLENHTNLIFLIDSSGSMSGIGEIALTSLHTILKSLQRVIEEEDIPVKIGVYGFDTHAYPLKTLDEPLDLEDIIRKYQTGGGTSLLTAVNEVSRLFQELGDSSEKILVVFTDAQTGDHEIRQLSNQANEDMKITYIGIHAHLGCQEARELFRSNIDDVSEVIPVFTKVLIED